jgi:N-acetylmuramic acid 6-phosphate etherase
MDTETISPRYRGLDTWSDSDILDALWEGQARAISVVHRALPAIASASTAIAQRIEPAGRMIYAGAGSSGHQAALDAMELAATFGWPKDRTVYVRAEQQRAAGLARATEDDATLGRNSVQSLNVVPADAVIAVAASGTTPYTVALADAARQAGAIVVGMANTAGAPLLDSSTHPILLETGAEVIAGSTRMNAGTAQKAALGLLSTLLMTRLGRTHDGLMVNMKVDRLKFSRRAVDVVATIAECSEQLAADALTAGDGRIKMAVLIARGASPAEAERWLAEANDNLRHALALRRADHH